MAAGDAVWLDVLPSMAGFAKTLAKDSAQAATTAGKSSGAAWAKSFEGAAGDSGSKKVVDELQRAAQRTKKVVDDQTAAIGRARGAQADAAAKVVEAERRLADARDTGDATKIEAAELRLRGARDRSESATRKLEQSEGALKAAHRENRTVTEQLARATKDLGDETADQPSAWQKVKSSVSDAGESMKTAATSVGGLVTGLVGAIGVAATFGQAWSDNMELSQGTAKVTAALDLSEEQSARAGEIAGGLFADNYGESISDVSSAVGSVMSSIEGMADAPAAELERVTAQALSMAEVFELDVSEAAAAAGIAVQNGLATDATHALDLMTSSLQQVPEAMRGDVLDAANEYGGVMSDLGLSGEQAFAMLTAGADKGTIGIDKVGDSLKEFTIRSTDMSKTSEDAYKAIGLDMGEMSNAILAGGEQAADATGQIVEGLLGIDDPAAQASAAIALFGTPLEDLGVAEIPSFLESLGAMDTGLGDVTGSAGDLDATMAEAVDPIDALKRDVQGLASDGLAALISGFEEGKGSGEGFVGVLSNVGAGISTAFTWIKENPDLLTAFAVGLGVLGTAWAAYTVYQWAANSAMLASPITWVVVGIAALAAGIVLAVQNWGAITDWLREKWEPIGAWFVGIWDGIKSGVGSAWDWVAGKLGSGWEWIQTNVFEPVKAGAGFVSTKFTETKDGISTAWTMVQSLLAAGWEWINTNVFDPIKAGAGYVSTKFTETKDGVIGAWDSLKSGLKAGWDWINENVFQRFNRGIDRIVEWVEDGVDRVGRGWARIANVFREPINWVINFVWNDGIKAAFDNVSSAVGSDARLPAAPTIPAFAQGGHHRGGLALVGEEGPELIRTGPAYIYTNAETEQMLTGAGGLNPLQQSFSASNPPHGGFWDDVGATWSRTWRGARDVVVSGAEAVAGWVRGGLANAADLVLSPLFNGLGGLVSHWGDMGGLGADTMVSAKDRLVDWIGGKDDEVGIDVDAGGRSLRGARSTVNAYAWGLADALGGIRTMQAFNQSMAGGHPEGRAVDFIDSRGKLDRLADLIETNGAALGLSYMAWQGQLWSPGGGWRAQGRGYGNDPQHRWHLHAEWPSSVYDQGGMLRPRTAAVNLSNASEAVLTGRQWADIHTLALGDKAAHSQPAVFELYDIDGELIGRMHGEARKVLDEEESGVTRTARQLSGRP